MAGVGGVVALVVAYRRQRISARVTFEGAEFRAGRVKFEGAEFNGGEVSFRGAKFAGGEVDLSEAVLTVAPVFDEGEKPGLKLPGTVGA